MLFLPLVLCSGQHKTPYVELRMMLRRGIITADRQLRALCTQHNYLQGPEKGEQGWIVFPVLVDGMRCAEGVGMDEDISLSL
jgi:hypothetical protein